MRLHACVWLNQQGAGSYLGVPEFFTSSLWLAAYRPWSLDRQLLPADSSGGCYRLAETGRVLPFDRSFRSERQANDRSC